jgi:hypothetical protein
VARNSQPIEAEIVKPPLWRRALLPGLLLGILAAVVFYFVWNTRASTAPQLVAEATDVRSHVARRGDSLEVDVEWRFETALAQSVPESIRVEVGLTDSEIAAVSTRSSDRRRDTLYVAVPASGGTADGYSCVSAIHRGRLMGESCTPWQFVVPGAAAADPGGDTTAQRRTAAATPRVARIVVQPSGLQVDPDPDGRCATWQRKNPKASVWLEINRKAVPECTGPNGKPTVAQFCAFAVLADGRRVLSRNSSGNAYCDRLFKEWSAERVS